MRFTFNKVQKLLLTVLCSLLPTALASAGGPSTPSIGAEDVVAYQGGTWTNACTQSGTWILGANSGVDIGDVTINNASGAGAVNIQDGGNSITVDGTISCNAGTNLNTSALALNTSVDGVEALLTTIDTSAANIDIDTSTIIGHVDGVEALLGTSNTNTGSSASSLTTLAGSVSSSRVQVNPIVGQAGIAAGTGVDGATVPRVSLATNVALPAGSNIIGALVANQSVNVAQINGVTPLMGNGASGTGAIRVAQVNDGTGVIATVSTVTNLAQMNGAAITMGNGASGTGVQRVTIANDSTGVIQCNAGTNLNTSALATSANQSTEITALQLIDNMISGSGVNISQMNGVNVSMGNGASDTGTQRVAVAVNNSSTMTEATCGITTTSASCLASSATRKSGWAQNNSDIEVWCSLGGTATAAPPSTKITAGGVLNLTTGGVIYTGAVNCIHAGTGTKNVTIASN